MEKIYEAVAVDEELGISEGSVKEEFEATTITEPSTDEIAYTTFVPTLHRNFIIVGYTIVAMLLIELNVSCCVEYFRVVVYSCSRPTLSSSLDCPTQNINFELHSSSAMWIAYVATELSFIGLIFMKLCLSYVGMQVYFVRFMLIKWSDVPIPNSVAFTVDVITACNFLIFYFLAMDGKISKTERNTAEVIILMALLIRCAFVDIST